MKEKVEITVETVFDGTQTPKQAFIELIKNKSQEPTQDIDFMPCDNYNEVIGSTNGLAENNGGKNS